MPCSSWEMFVPAYCFPVWLCANSVSVLCAVLSASELNLLLMLYCCHRCLPVTQEFLCKTVQSTAGLLSVSQAVFIHIAVSLSVFFVKNTVCISFTAMAWPYTFVIVRNFGQITQANPLGKYCYFRISWADIECGIGAEVTNSSHSMWSELLSGVARNISASTLSALGRSTDDVLYKFTHWHWLVLSLKIFPSLAVAVPLIIFGGGRGTLALGKPSLAVASTIACDFSSPCHPHCTFRHNFSSARPIQDCRIIQYDIKLWRRWCCVLSDGNCDDDLVQKYSVHTTLMDCAVIWKPIMLGDAGL